MDKALYLTYLTSSHISNPVRADVVTNETQVVVTYKEEQTHSNDITVAEARCGLPLLSIRFGQSWKSAEI